MKAIVLILAVISTVLAQEVSSPYPLGRNIIFVDGEEITRVINVESNGKASLVEPAEGVSASKGQFYGAEVYEKKNDEGVMVAKANTIRYKNPEFFRLMEARASKDRNYLLADAYAKMADQGVLFRVVDGEIPQLKLVTSNKQAEQMAAKTFMKLLGNGGTQFQPTTKISTIVQPDAEERGEPIVTQTAAPAPTIIKDDTGDFPLGRTLLFVDKNDRPHRILKVDEAGISLSTYPTYGRYEAAQIHGKVEDSGAGRFELIKKPVIVKKGSVEKEVRLVRFYNKDHFEYQAEKMRAAGMDERIVKGFTQLAQEGVLFMVTGTEERPALKPILTKDAKNSDYISEYVMGGKFHDITAEEEDEVKTYAARFEEFVAAGMNVVEVKELGEGSEAYAQVNPQQFLFQDDAAMKEVQADSWLSLNPSEPMGGMILNSNDKMYEEHSMAALIGDIGGVLQFDTDSSSLNDSLFIRDLSFESDNPTRMSFVSQHNGGRFQYVVDSLTGQSLDDQSRLPAFITEL